MISKSSQGLSFSTIVLAVISIFILVLVILFVQGGLTGIRRPIQDISPTTISNARNVCTAFCNEAQATVRTLQDFQNSRYCTKTFLIDKGGGGGVTKQEPDTKIDIDPAGPSLYDDKVQCFDEEQGSSPLWSGRLGPCTISLSDGTTVSSSDNPKTPLFPNRRGCPLL